MPSRDNTSSTMAPFIQADDEKPGSPGPKASAVGLATHTLPADYLERVYAAVLGKFVGVYVGRPVEQWTYEHIMDTVGPVRYYVHQKVGTSPLVVIDDDISGTFVFIRALEEHGIHLSAADIGRTWLNNTVENKSIFWWGGRGISTEHTAFLNLKRGIKAPASGSTKTNGQTIAEQIGGQIFIDAWAMVAPGNPELAAKLAEAAASVSHDGDSVNAAKSWAAMEAEAFVSKDVNHLLDIGFSHIPAETALGRAVRDVRQWAESGEGWEVTRQRIEEAYGYHKFPGECHVVPNHCLMVSTLIYAHHNFHLAMYIINTSGWDTDCNAGNLACLVAIMHGLSAFENGPDWLGPMAERALISSADGGFSINNASRIAYDVANMGHRLAGVPTIPEPKGGAQFHFSLPGGVQGFTATRDELIPDLVRVKQAVDAAGRPGLAIDVDGLTNAVDPVEVMTPVFSPPEIMKMKKTYDLMASPLIYPGQTVTAVVRADPHNTSASTVSVNLRLKHFNDKDTLTTVDGPSTTLTDSKEHTLTWTIPDTFDSQPIQQIGLALSCATGTYHGIVWLDTLSYAGTPHTSLKRPESARKSPRSFGSKTPLCDFWRRAWIDNLSMFRTKSPDVSFHLSQDQGEGIATTGTRDWVDYRVAIPGFKVKMGSAGLAVRVRGLHRYYALMFRENGRSVAVVKARDEIRTDLAVVDFGWKVDAPFDVAVVVDGDRITGYVGEEKVIEARDHEFTCGGVGAVLVDGCAAVESWDIQPLA